MEDPVGQRPKFMDDQVIYAPDPCTHVAVHILTHSRHLKPHEVVITGRVRNPSFD